MANASRKQRIIKQGFGKYWNITQDIEKAEFVVDSLIELCDIL